MTEDLLPYDEINKAKFTKRAVDVPSNYRFFRKLAQMALVIQESSRFNSSSVLKLQLFNWAFFSQSNFNELIKLLGDNNHIRPFIPLDPFVNKAVDYGLAYKFFSQKKGKIALTNKGLNLYNYIISDPELLSEEKRMMSALEKRLFSETNITGIMKSIGASLSET